MRKKSPGDGWGRGGGGRESQYPRPNIQWEIEGGVGPAVTPYLLQQAFSFKGWFGYAAEEGGVAEWLEAGEVEELSALKVAEIFSAEGVEVAVKKLNSMRLAIGAAGGTNGLSFGVSGGADDACAKESGGGLGFGGEDEQGVGEVAKVTMEDRVENLEGLGEFPGADIVAGAIEGTGKGVGAGSENVKVEIFDGVGAQAAHVVAGIVNKGLADDQASAGCQGARGAREERSAGFRGELVEDVVEENDVELFGIGGEFFEGRGICAEGDFGPAGAAERGKLIMKTAQGGAGVIPSGESDGARAEVIEKSPRSGAGACAEVEDAQGDWAFGKGGEFRENVGKAGIGLGSKEEGIGGAGARIAKIGRGSGGCIGGAGCGEAIREANDVGQHSMQNVAGGGGVGFGAGNGQPVGFEFGWVINVHGR